MQKNKLETWMGLGAASLLGLLSLKYIARFAVNKIHDSFLKRITSDLYDENLYETVSSTMRIGSQVTLETSLRAQEGKLIERPMGPPKKFPDMDDIKFNFAQLFTMPTDMKTEIDYPVVIGKYAKRPLKISHPMIIAPMAYGIALSRNMKLALAKGSAAADTATHIGAGAFLPEERALAKHLIFQYNRGDWNKNPEHIRQCDAVEIQLGQGAYGGVGHIFSSTFMDKQLRKDFNKNPGEDLITQSRQPEVQNPEDLKKLVDKLRDITDGIPVGVKIAAGKYLEMDLYWICTSGVDFVVIDGGEAATKGSPPVLQDDFGVPTVFAVNRAAAWMEKHGFKERISLIVSGRIRTPGDALKAIALGADACMIGSIALVAASHPQVVKSLPFEPPTGVAWYGENASRRFSIDRGAKSLANFLNSCKLEMSEAIRALGKTSLYQVSKQDLMTTNEMLAKGLNIPMAYEPYDPTVPEPPRIKKVKLT